MGPMTRFIGPSSEPADHETLERDLLLAQRSLVGRIDSLGIIAVAVFVPMALADHVALPLSISWSALVVVSTLGWSSGLAARFAASQTVAVWASAVVWATLPWLAWSALGESEVAWIMAAVCGYGLGTDALLLPQTFRLRVYPLMFSYLASYLLALGLRGHWVPVLGLLAFAAHLAGGVGGFEQIKRRLLSDRAETEAEAYSDQLTGLRSRGAAIREIERRLAAGERVHCVIADVDDFKALNTHLGHHGGDAALLGLADALQRHLRSWYIARLGGDEFVAINRRGLHPSEESGLMTIDVGEVGTERSRRILSLSLGASSIEPPGTPDELLTEAGAALRLAKDLGKRRMIVADDVLRDHEDDRQRLAARAHQAIADGEIIAWGQPIFDLTAQRPAGIELLARWPQASGEMEMPGAFVPIIEAQGLGSMLAERMIARAVEVIESLDRLGDSRSFVSVNLSAFVLLEPELADRVAAKLRNANVTANRLVIEMTESQRLPDNDTARDAIARLRGVGVGIATDDLGAGWSSINQMLETAFTHVKVDRTLTHAGGRPGATELLHALRLLAAGADQVPIAEGIETDDDLTRVVAAGYELGQGYLLARPAPLDEVMRRFAASAQSLPFDARQPTIDARVGRGSS